MGMFDWVKFPYRMPDGYEGHTYQTKWLECELNEFDVTPVGRLVRSAVLDNHSKRSVGDTGFDGVLWIGDADPGSGRHCYNLQFRAGQLVAIECLQTKTTMIFDSQRMLSLPENAGARQEAH